MGCRRSVWTRSTRRRGADGELAFRDRSYRSRIGWREITVSAATARASSRPRRLRAAAATRFARIPRNMLSSPLDVRSAAVRVDARRRPGVPPSLETVAAPRALGRRVRGADRPGRPVGRRRPALAARRRVLGCRARADAGARQGARRRLPRGHPRKAAPCVRPRGDRDGDPHGRRLRARSRDARALALHRARAALSLADTRLGPARRRGGRGVLAEPAPPGGWSRPSRTGSTTHAHDHDDHHHHHDGHHHHHHERRDLARASSAWASPPASLPCPSALVVLLSRDRAPPDRVRHGADRRVQPRARRDDHRHRPRRRARPAAFSRVASTARWCVPCPRSARS